MMLKAMGIVMIIGSCSALGFSKSRSYARRKETIRSLISAFEIIKAEIVFRHRPVCEMLSVAVSRTESATADYFAAISEKMTENGLDFAEACRAMMPQLSKACLKKSDIAEIEGTLASIGKYDAQVQAELINTTLSRLMTLLEEADSELAKNGKLCSALGVTAGITAAIILL